MDAGELVAQLKEFEGQKVAVPIAARDPVNQPMIRHWCDAIGDRNPAYTDPEFAARSRHGEIVAPPTMLQAWSMRGLQPAAERANRLPGPQAGLFGLLDAAGFTSVVATNCAQDYHRYLVLGDHLTVSTCIESVSDEKRTALGVGHFITQRMTYLDQRGEEVATMHFRLLKFRPRSGRPAKPPREARPRPQPAVTHDNRFFWDGIADGKLLIQRCAGCGKLRHPPGPMCPACRSLEWDAVPASGRGAVYSFVVAHHPAIPPFAYPNAIALVELEEGTRVVSNVLGMDPAEVHVGMEVRAVFPELEEGRRFLQFESVSGAKPEEPADAVPSPTGEAPVARDPASARVGDALPGLDVPLTATTIIAGALASRDYQDVHHDRDLAVKRGSKDIFMNILTTNGWVGRFVTDWAGPETLLRRVDIRLGVPNYPGDTMRLTGRVAEREGDHLRVEIVGANGLGHHVTGSVDLELSR